MDMMGWAQATEDELREKGEIPTDFGETLSWDYLCFVRENPICWDVPTSILYAERDQLIARDIVESFAQSHHAAWLSWRVGSIGSIQRSSSLSCEDGSKK